MAIFIILIVGWIAVYFISKGTGDKHGQDKAEHMLTSGLGFRGCGVIILIVLVIVVVLFFYLLSLFE
ncbi:hypothetical protein [Paenibacillus sp. sgz500958]|uniref:hypothetical protein n=1 Tax=Paenibacillus sp. sgz500958 TaxID=3242475 RepID=UPI0036D2CF5F